MSARALGSVRTCSARDSRLCCAASALLCASECERIGPLAAAQQQREENGLGVGVGKALVRRVGKEQLPPVLRQLDQWRIRAPERVGHIVAQHTAERRQQLSEAPEVDAAFAVGGNERLPHQEIAQQTFKRVRVLRPYRFLALGGDIAGETDNFAGKFAVTIERPFVAAGVQKIGDGREAFELIQIMVLKEGGGHARANGFEFHIAGEQLVQMDRVIRAAQTIGQRRFARADNIPAERVGGSAYEILKWRAQLLFRLAVRDLRQICPLPRAANSCNAA